MAKLATLFLALWAFYWRAQLEVLVVALVNAMLGVIAAGVVGVWAFADPPWIYVFAVAAGLGVFAISLVLAPLGIQRFRARSGARGKVPPELYELLQGYARPAFESASSLLTTAAQDMRDRENQAERDLSGSFQRALDDGAAGYGAASNAILHQDGSDPDEGMGSFHSAYQKMAAWIDRGLEHSALRPDMFWYQQWREADEDFLRKLREVAAKPERQVLYDRVQAAGWGEGVRARPPKLGESTPTPARDRLAAVSWLREYAANEASASIVLYPESQRPLADKIVTLFQDAGWNAGAPSASFEKWHGYFKGVEVRGCDPDRIDVVANALTAAGVPMVRTFVAENELSPDHPKYQQRRQSVQVRVGYTSMDKL